MHYCAFLRVCSLRELYSPFAFVAIALVSPTWRFAETFVLHYLMTSDLRYIVLVHLSLGQSLKLNDLEQVILASTWGLAYLCFSFQ